MFMFLLDLALSLLVCTRKELLSLRLALLPLVGGQSHVLPLFHSREHRRQERSRADATAGLLVPSDFLAARCLQRGKILRGGKLTVMEANLRSRN